MKLTTEVSPMVLFVVFQFLDITRTIRWCARSVRLGVLFACLLPFVWPVFRGATSLPITSAMITVLPAPTSPACRQPAKTAPTTASPAHPTLSASPAVQRITASSRALLAVAALWDTMTTSAAYVWPALWGVLPAGRVRCASAAWTNIF